jgi:PAS domain S-box-containing protein
MPPGSRITESLQSILRAALGSGSVARKMALVFVLVGTAWVFLEEYFLGGHAFLKDLVFVLGTAFLLYALIKFATTTIRKGDAELREAEEHLRDIMECNPTGVLLIDGEGRFSYGNSAAMRILGKGRSEILGRTLQDFSWKATTEGDPTSETEICVERPDGIRIILSVNTARLHGTEGKPAGTVVSFADITESKRARELALQESREKYHNLLETVNDVVWEVDEGMTITYLNNRVQEIFGYGPEEMIGRTPFDFLAETDSERIAKVLAPSNEHFRPFGNFEVAVSHRKGHIVYLEVSGSPFPGPDGKVGWRGVASDISRKKMAEIAALEKEAQFQAVFVQNEYPILLFRPGTAQVLDANPAAESLYGYSREELLETGLAPVVDPADYEALARWIGSIDTDNRLALDELHHVRKDGRRIIVSVRGQLIGTVSGGSFAYCSFRDITERIRMEEEVKLRQAELIHTSRMAFLGKIVAEIAHELNNPNNLIMFNTPMVQLAWEDAVRVLERHRRETGDFPLGGLPFSEMRDSVPRLLQGISEASIRMGNYVESLNEFSRPETREQDRAVSVRRIISSAICILNHEIMKRCNDFLVDYPPDSLVVAGSRVELEQVLINLIHNSLHALPDRDRPVRVSASANELSDSVEIVVRDEGEGMSPDVMKNILKPFFTTKQDSGGLGLGLSISRSIIDRHKGTLVFDSEVGKGTTARIILPGLGLREGQGTMTPSVDYPR